MLETWEEHGRDQQGVARYSFFDPEDITWNHPLHENFPKSGHSCFLHSLWMLPKKKKITCRFFQSPFLDCGTLFAPEMRSLSKKISHVFRHACKNMLPV